MDPYSWAWNPEAIVLVLLGGGYVLLARRYGAERWRIACFVAGLAMLLAATVSPLHTLALHYLLSAHLLQNVILAEWAPALCVLGFPAAIGAAAVRARALAFITHPLVALPVWLGSYFAWHLPAAYDAALRHPHSLLHLEHLCYFVTGCALWWPVLHSHPALRSSGAKAGYLFAAFALASPLGLLLALLPNAVYRFYVHAPDLWGLSALTDQQIAGVTMASEQAVVFFAAFLVFFLRFMAEEEREPEPV